MSTESSSFNIGYIEIEKRKERERRLYCKLSFIMEFLEVQIWVKNELIANKNFQDVARMYTNNEYGQYTCMHGVIWLPLNWTFSIVPPMDSTRGFKVSSRRSVSSIVSELNFT